MGFFSFFLPLSSFALFFCQPPSIISSASVFPRIVLSEKEEVEGCRLRRCCACGCEVKKKESQEEEQKKPRKDFAFSLSSTGLHPFSVHYGKGVRRRQARRRLLQEQKDPQGSPAQRL